MIKTSALQDGLAQKSARLERCVQRAREEHANATEFLTDFTRQDAAILNIQRACELAIDMGNMAIAFEGWGLPASAREVFATLRQRTIIDTDMAHALERMVGFRNIAVHGYQVLDMTIVAAVIQRDIDCLPQFAGKLLGHYLKRN